MNKTLKDLAVAYGFEKSEELETMTKKIGLSSNQSKQLSNQFDSVTDKFTHDRDQH